MGGFLHPALAFGALLAAVPLIIHLLNRQRHVPLDWAAMRFVLAAYRKVRRRSQLENLLLLLLRMAAVALLALALSRPFTGGGGPLAALTEMRRDVLLVLDASASTEYRGGVESVHEEIVERAREICRDLDRARGDRVRVVLAGATPTLVAWRAPDEALAALTAFTEARHEAMDVPAALAEVARLVTADRAEGETGELEVRLLTDLQRSAFEARPVGATPAGALPADPAAEPAPLDPAGAATPPDGAADPDGTASNEDALLAQLDRLQELGVRVVVEAVGGGAATPSNLSVEALHALSPVLGAGTPLEVAVVVRNHGETARPGVRVALSIDGERRPSQLVDVPARGAAQAVFPVVFDAPGARVLEASLPGDSLALDDARAHVLEVPDAISALLVDGAPDPDVERDAVGLLAAVLDPFDDDLGASAPFRARVVEPNALGTTEVDLAQHEIVWLANVQHLPEHVVELLEQRVAAGAGLVISLGPNVDPAVYARSLWRADGSGLLPAQLSRAVHGSTRADYFRAASFDEAHPALSFFADDRWRMLLTEAPVFSFVPARPAPDARVLATLDDEGAHPLLVERDYARGRVVLWTTTVDPSWTMIPDSPRTLVPLVHELLRDLATPPAAPRNLPVGAAPTAEVETFPLGTALVGPTGARQPLEGEALEVAEGVWRLPPAPPLDRAGAWRIELGGADRAGDALASLAFAAQLDPRESDLARATEADLPTHPALVVATDADDVGVDAADPEARGELWRVLAWACLAALVLESLWSAFLGHRRRMP